MHAARRSTRRAPAADQLAFSFDRDEAAANDALSAPALAAVSCEPVGQADCAELRPIKTRKARARHVTPLRPRPLIHAGDAERALTVDEAAQLLSVSVKTLKAWRRLGKGPVFVKLGRSVRYTMRPLDQFTNERTVRNSAEGRLLDAHR